MKTVKEASAVCCSFLDGVVICLLKLGENIKLIQSMPVMLSLYVDPFFCASFCAHTFVRLKISETYFCTEIVSVQIQFFFRQFFLSTKIFFFFIANLDISNQFFEPNYLSKKQTIFGTNFNIILIDFFLD